MQLDPQELRTIKEAGISDHIDSIYASFLCLPDPDAVQFIPPYLRLTYDGVMTVCRSVWKYGFHTKWTPVVNPQSPLKLHMANRNEHVDMRNISGSGWFNVVFTEMRPTVCYRCEYNYKGNESLTYAEGFFLAWMTGIMGYQLAIRLPEFGPPEKYACDAGVYSELFMLACSPLPKRWSANIRGGKAKGEKNKAFLSERNKVLHEKVFELLQTGLSMSDACEEAGQHVKPEICSDRARRIVNGMGLLGSPGRPTKTRKRTPQKRRGTF